MLNITDLFCGAGGSSTGAIQVPGIEVRVASNHWDLAVETHNSNHPDADHICADISQIDPRYFPTSDILWASPSCTNHSRAKGRKQDTLQGDLFDERVPDEAAERSRATMWDVVRFAEHHQYAAVIVENVIEVAAWLPFRAWLLAMDALGYDHQIVSLNSMHAQAQGAPAAQSRDRLYVVFHRKGNRRPDVASMQRPKAWCPACCEVVGSVQSWKRQDSGGVGRYRSQYVYRCPNASCRNAVVEPGWLPASSIIDWTLQGHRIGDRAKPLAEKTRRRIAAGIARYWGPIHLEAAGNTYDAADPKHAQFGNPNSYYRAWAADDVIRTLHTIESKALAVPPLLTPVGGKWDDTARSSNDVMRTQTTNDGVGVVFPASRRALITSYYGSSDGAQPIGDALPTVTTTDRHALLMRNNTGGAEMTTPAWEAARTITTAGHQSVLTPGDIDAAAAQVDDVMFRMLEPSEVKGAMAFPAEYRILGNRREQVRMCGNAVTPPSARDLITAVAESLVTA